MTRGQVTQGGPSTARRFGTVARQLRAWQVRRRESASRGAPVVAQVTPYYPPSLGGMESVARALAEALSNNMEVVVLTTDHGRGEAPRRARRGHLGIFRERSVVIAHTPLSPGLAWRLLRLPRGTVIHAHLADAFLPEVVWLAARLRRSPYIAHFHMEVDPSGWAGALLHPYQRMVLGPVLRGADRVITLAPGQRDFLAERYAVDPERVLVMANGVSPDIVRPDAPPTRGAGSGPLKLLFVGRLDAQKNVGRLLDAMGLVEAAVELTVVGTGEQADSLASRVEDERLESVHLVGPRRGSELMAAYAAADAMVLTSDREGMPLVLLDAMACGLPIVATDVEGIRLTVADAGLIVPPDARSIAEAITRLAEDPDLHRELAERSYRRGAQFTWDANVETLTILYESLRSGHVRVHRPRAPWSGPRAAR